MLQCAIGEHCGLCLALLGLIDRDRMLTDLDRVAIWCGKQSRLQAPPSALPSATLRAVAGEGALSQHDPAAPQPE
jgi:hypothetical protein